MNPYKKEMSKMTESNCCVVPHHLFMMYISFFSKRSCQIARYFTLQSKQLWTRSLLTDCLLLRSHSPYPRVLWDPSWYPLTPIVRSCISQVQSAPFLELLLSFTVAQLKMSSHNGVVFLCFCGFSDKDCSKLCELYVYIWWRQIELL